jgi:hypothetical protein
VAGITTGNVKRLAESIFKVTGWVARGIEG